MVRPWKQRAGRGLCSFTLAGQRSDLARMLVLALSSLFILAGCGGNTNKTIELVKRVENDELGCHISPSALVEQEGLAYAASASNLVILDVSDPLNPRCLSSYDTNKIVTDVVLSEPYAFLAAEELIVMDVSNPRNPVELFRYSSDSVATDIKLKDGHLFLTAVQNGLLIFDISNPAKPELVAQINFPDAGAQFGLVHVTAVDFVNDYAYVLVKGDYPYFIAILDVRDPAAPKVIRRFVPESELDPWDIVVHGQHAYLNGGFRYIDVVDVSDPLAPRLAGSVDIPGGLMQYVVDGNYVFVGGGENISVIDVANPAQPRVAGFYEVGNNNISRVGDYVYSVGQTLENGKSQPPKLHIFRFTP